MRPVNDEDASMVLTAIESLDGVRSAAVHPDDPKTINLSIEETIEAPPFGHYAKWWKYGWYQLPISSAIVLTRLSDAITEYGEVDGVEKSAVTLGFGDALVLGTSEAGSTTRALHRVRTKPFLNLPRDARSVSQGTDPGSLSMAKTAHPPMGGRGQTIRYGGTLQRTRTGDWSIIELAS